MKDKITRLSKGITDIESPVINITPGLFSESVFAERNTGFAAELISNGGDVIKGIAFPDNLRISVEPRAFSGRRVHLNIYVDTRCMVSGDELRGEITLTTNGGELKLPYEFSVREVQSASDIRYEAHTAVTGTTGNTAELNETDPYAFAPEHDDTPYSADKQTMPYPQSIADDPLRYEYSVHLSAESDLKNPLTVLLTSEIPEDEPLFEGILSELVSSENVSAYAFSMYAEAIRRGLTITRLYECYVLAFPADSDEMMPREVLLYFSYERDAKPAILKKIYRNLIRNVDRESELYAYYEPLMSNFAMSCALSQLIDDDLAVIYDRMIYPGMIDHRAALVFPDLFKCSRIRADKEAADFLIVSYPGLKTGMRALFRAGTAYVPVYFKDADIRYYKGHDPEQAEDVTDTIAAERTELFARPDILRRCFELESGHKMLLLSAVKEISDRGISSDEEVAVAVRGLTELELAASLRASLIESLCEHGSYNEWADAVNENDFAGEAGSWLFGMLVSDPEQYAARAYALMNSCGADRLPPSDVLKLVSYIISSRAADAFNDAEKDRLISICRMLFDLGVYDKHVLGFLVAEFEGSISEMYAVAQAAIAHEMSPGGLPEKILSVNLFTGSDEHIDESFSLYVERCDYTELIVKAYFTVRCTDAFLHGARPAETMYEALESYLMNSQDPLLAPLIYRLALTEYYAGKPSVSDDEIRLCQLLTDDLIASGYIFAYTKKLRKKIHIPDDVISRYYIQYNSKGDEAPKLLIRILPDNKEYHAADMHRVYRNIYIMSTILFKGDELQYIIYDSSDQSEPSEEGIISVRKFHRQRDAVFASLDTMTKAIDDKDIELLKENMLDYAEKTAAVRLLFDLEN